MAPAGLNGAAEAVVPNVRTARSDKAIKEKVRVMGFPPQ
jgi:hypothetical protein